MTRRAAVVALAALTGCGGQAFRSPGNIRGYEIVVTGRDSVSRAFARQLAEEGFRVRGAVRGGNRPAALLVHFVFQEPNGPTVLYGRLADTRSGAVVAAATVVLDGTRGARLDSVPAVVRALASQAR